MRVSGSHSVRHQLLQYFIEKVKNPLQTVMDTLKELKRSLYCLFSQYGRILDVVALKTSRLRGQAWIVFDEITAASSALRQMQGFPFYDKPMRIQYGKSKSDAIAKADGSYLPRDKRKKQEEKVEKKRKEQDAPHAGNGAPRSYESNMDSKSQNQQRKSNGQEAPASPNSILFIQNLPHETTTMMLQLLFEQYPGFKEVRMVDAKPGIAFIEYVDDMQSTVAMQALQGFKITPQNPMLISYAKK